MAIEDISEDTGSRPGTDRNQSGYRQAISALYLRGAHAADDTDNHDYRFPARGKARLTALVSSTADTTHNLTIYGSHNTTGAPGEQGVTQIGSATITGTTGGFLTTTGGAIFPHYIVRVQTDTAGAGQSAGATVNVFIGMSAFP